MTRKETAAQIDTARKLGTAAFAAGMKRAPYQDAALTELLKDNGMGNSNRQYEAWLSAFDRANLAASV